MQDLTPTLMRYRFVDRVVGFTPPPDATITIEKTFSAGDDCFTGPVPDVVAVSLLIETVAMAGGHLLLRALAEDRLPLLLKVEDALVLAPVRPGETIQARVALRGAGKAAEPAIVAQTEGEASVEGRPVLRCRLLYACVRVPGLLSEGSHPRSGWALERARSSVRL